MSDDALLWTHRPPPLTRQPRASEPLWEIQRDGVTWSPELRCQGEYVAALTAECTLAMIAPAKGGDNGQEEVRPR